MNKLTKNKIAQGLVSFITVIILLFSILATSIFYENQITGNVISDVSIEDTSIEIQYVNDITDLSQLNEGWYEIRNGYVFYLEHFDSAVPLYIKIQNPREQNGILVVDVDGNVEFEGTFEKIAVNKNYEYGQEPVSTITGMATGMERVSGFQTADTPQKSAEYESGTSAVFKYEEGKALTGNLYYKYDAKIGWQWSNNGRKWKSAKNEAPRASLIPGTGYSKNNINFIKSLGNTDFNNGIKKLLDRTESDRGGWFASPNLVVYADRTLTIPSKYVGTLKIDEVLSVAKGSLKAVTIAPTPTPKPATSPSTEPKTQPVTIQIGKQNIPVVKDEKNKDWIRIDYKEGDKIKSYALNEKNELLYLSGDSWVRAPVGDNNAAEKFNKDVQQKMMAEKPKLISTTPPKQSATISSGQNIPPSPFTAIGQPSTESSSKQQPAEATYRYKNLEGKEVISKEPPPPNVQEYFIEYTQDGKQIADHYKDGKPVGSFQWDGKIWTSYTALAPTSGAPKPPTFSPSDNLADIQRKTEDYKLILDKWAKTQKTQKGIEDVQKAYDAYLKALNTPRENEAKEKFEVEYLNFQFSQKTPDEIVSSYTSGSINEQKLAKELLTKNYNDPELMSKLALSSQPETKVLIRQIILEKGKDNEAYNSLSSDQKAEIDTHLQNNEVAKQAGVKYDPNIVDYYNGAGFIVSIGYDSANGKFIATQTTTRYAGTAPGAEAIKKLFTPEQIQAIEAQGLYVNEEGKIVDVLRNEYSSVLKSNPKGTKPEERWIVNKETKKAPLTIKLTDKELRKHSDNYILENGLAVYVDSAGKLYSQQGNLLDDKTKIIKTKEFGKDVKSELILEISKGKVNKDNPVSAKINGVQVPLKVFNEFEGFLKQAGQNPVVEGKFTQDSPLYIKNEKGETIGSGYNFNNIEGISSGTRIESNFQNGEPLLRKSTSEDGKTTITQTNEFKEIIRRDSNGNILRDENGKEIKDNVLQTKSWIRTGEAKVTKDGKEITVQTITRRSFETDKKTGLQKKDYIDYEVDSRTREPISTKVTSDDNIKYTIKYTEKGVKVYDPTNKELDDAAIEGLSKEIKDKINDNKNNHRKWTSQKFFANVERVFTEFRGLGYYATLFLDEDFLHKWREKVDQTFAHAYLGTEYWSSAICSGYIDGAQEGIAYAETPQGLAQIGAHVEATRTQAIITENGTSYIYKITFNVRNGDYEKDLRAPEDMNINVIIKGATIVNIFKNDVNIKRGSTFGKSGKNAIVKESKNLYNQICIRFDKIPLKWKKLKDKQLCNIIQESSGEPTKITTPATAEQKKAQEAELNDF